MTRPEELLPAIDKTPAETAGFNPYYHSLSSGLGKSVAMEGRAMLDFASNNYLGLASDTRVIEAAAGAIRRYGVSLCGTPVATGYSELLRRTETELAAWLGFDDAILLPSCYQANATLFPHIASQEDVILIDHFAHASLVNGVRGSGARVMPFLHNNTDHLASRLASLPKARRIFVVTESVFSTEGSVAPLDGIHALCERHGACCVVDDSHGIGVIGGSGKGILEAKSVSGFNGIYTASLGKAFANLGGLIAGNARFLDSLRYSQPSYIYSTALPPACAAGLLAVLKIVKDEFPRLSERLRRNTAILRSCLEDAGIPASRGEAPITSIMCDSTERTLRITREIFEAGILSTPFLEPSVPKGKALIRLITGAHHPEETVRAGALKIAGIGFG